MGEAEEVEEGGGTQAQGGGVRRGGPSTQQRNGGAGSNTGGSQHQQNGMHHINGTQAGAADGSGVLTMRREGTAGQLKKIRLDDFMCHECFEMDFGWVDGCRGGAHWWCGGKAAFDTQRPLTHKQRPLTHKQEGLAFMASRQGSPGHYASNLQV